MSDATALNISYALMLFVFSGMILLYETLFLHHFQKSEMLLAEIENGICVLIAGCLGSTTVLLSAIILELREDGYITLSVRNVLGELEES
jgi:hypothetical protein